MRQYLKLQFKKHAHRLSLSGRQQRKPFVESACVEMKPNILREFAMEIGDQVSWQMEPHAFGIEVREACRRAVELIDRDSGPIVLLVSFTSGGSGLRTCIRIDFPVHFSGPIRRVVWERLSRKADLYLDFAEPVF